MKVELERKTDSVGSRSVTVLATGDCTSNPATIEKWIAMLKVAEKWLRTGK
jgi:hypothetical protein